MNIFKSLRIKEFINKDKNLFRLFIVLILVFIGCSLLKPDLFLTPYNFQSMGKQFPEFGLLSIGIGLTLLTGGIDLSAVSIANFSSIVAAMFMLGNIGDSSTPGQNVIVLIAASIIAIMIGAISGAMNGIIISKIGIPPILATLGTQQLFAGIAIVITGGKALSGLPIMYSKLMNKNILGIPFILFLFIICAIIIGFILVRTTNGLKLYLLGTNSKATEYTGISNSKSLVFTYMLSGILASIAGLIMMGRSNSAKADYGSSYVLQCVLIAVLGGVSPNGGKGNVQGIAIAVIILQMLSSGLNMFENISNFYRDLIWGALLILVLIFNYMIDKREQKAA